MKILVLAHIICLDLVLSNAQSFSKGKCELEPPSRGILDLKQELKPARLLNVTTLDHLKDCGELCCNWTKCNAYIWRNSEQCFLFNCRVLTDCKVVPYQGTITGFIKKDERAADFTDNGIQETQHTKLSGDVSNRTPVESKKSNDNEVQSSPNSNKTPNSVRIQSLTIKKKPTSGKAAITDKKASSKSSDSEKRTVKGHNMTSSKLSTSSHTTTKVSKTLRKRGKMSKSNNTKQTIPVLNSSRDAQKVSHTTTTSLIAALTFGVVFLVAVLLLIGRPWWDSLALKKDGYNRITFLMNGN